jgi:malic enzyme
LQGLITADRGDELASHKVRYARHDNQGQQYKDLQAIVDFVKPTALIGLSGQPRAFTEEIIRAVAAGYDKPIVMALSNPTDKAECTAEQAYTWTDGNAIFAAGSPFAPVEYKGKTYIPGQGNNMFIFPGLGFGAYTARCKTVSEPMIIAAAKTLAHTVTDEEIASGNIYPSLKKIRAISADIAAAVGEVAWKDVSAC